MSTRTAFDQDQQIAAMVGFVLLVATYLAFSIRAVTDPFDPGELLSAKRFVVATVGAGLFWLVARYARKDWSGLVPARIVGVALLSVAALGFVLATRIGYDLLITGETEAMLVRNMRWTIIWLGYFGTALLGYFAIMFGLSLRRAAPMAVGTRQDRLAAVLTEVATWSASERLMLAAVLDGPAVYECADPLFVAWQHR